MNSALTYLALSNEIDKDRMEILLVEIKIKKSGEESETRTNLPTISAVIRIGNENLETSRKCFPYFYIFQDSSYLQGGDAS